MQPITLSDAVMASLRDGFGEVKVCDESGNLVGYLISPATRKLFYELLIAELDDNEALKEARRENDAGGVSFEQIMEEVQAYEAELRKQRGAA